MVCVLTLLVVGEDWNSLLNAIDDWSAWLSMNEESEKLDVLRKHVEKGLPCGDEGFVRKLGRKIGRVLEARPQGRPRRENIGKG